MGSVVLGDFDESFGFERVDGPTLRPETLDRTERVFDITRKDPTNKGEIWTRERNHSGAVDLRESTHTSPGKMQHERSLVRRVGQHRRIGSRELVARGHNVTPATRSGEPIDVGSHHRGRTTYPDYAIELVDELEGALLSSGVSPSPTDAAGEDAPTGVVVMHVHDRRYR